MSRILVFRFPVILGVVCVFLGSALSLAWADKVPPPRRAETRKPASARPAARPVARPAKDDDKELVDLSKRKPAEGWDRPYLLAAYGLTWLILMLYLVSLASRMSSTESRLESMERQLKDQLSED